MLLPTLAACEDNFKPNNANENSPTSAAVSNPIPPLGTRVSLTITGYNYTDRYIDQFTVNGNGGGNLFVSGPTSGGGGSECCKDYITGVDNWILPVRWQVGGCTYNTSKQKDGSERYDLYHYFKEVEVKVDPKIAARPAYLEVHFYPDEHVELAVTEHSSPPRLKLSKDREVKSSYKQCPNDKRPEE